MFLKEDQNKSFKKHFVSVLSSFLGKNSGKKSNFNFPGKNNVKYNTIYIIVNIFI